MFDPQKTLIITDFDGTLSKRYVDGTSVSSTMSILRDGHYLSEESTLKAQEISSHYYPMELDPHLDFQHKCQMMDEWWQKSYEIMAEGGLNKNIILEVARNKKLQLRNKVESFFQFTADKNIPVIIYSASGIGGNVIPVVLNDRGL